MVIALEIVLRVHSKWRNIHSRKLTQPSSNSQTSCHLSPGPSSSPSAGCLGKIFLGILLWAMQPGRLGGVGVEGASLLPQLQFWALFSLCRGQAAWSLAIPSPAHVAETLVQEWLKGRRLPIPHQSLRGRRLPQVWQSENPGAKKGVATPSSLLAWRIPWREEPGGLQSAGLQRVEHNWATKQQQQLPISQKGGYAAPGEGRASWEDEGLPAPTLAPACRGGFTLERQPAVPAPSSCKAASRCCPGREESCKQLFWKGLTLSGAELGEFQA